MSREICFQESDFKLYLFLLIIIIIYLFYIHYQYNLNFIKESMANVDLYQNLTKEKLKNKLDELQNELYKSQISEQKCVIELNSIKEQSIQSEFVQNKLLNKIYNPLVSPERIYPGGRFNINSYSNYQLIGFVYNDIDRYPLYGRPKYAGKTDKYEYYIIDESRNRLKIPFKSKNDNELYSTDQIDIPGIGSAFNVTIYEYDNLRYDPTVF